MINWLKLLLRKCKTLELRPGPGYRIKPHPNGGFALDLQQGKLGGGSQTSSSSVRPWEEGMTVHNGDLVWILKFGTSLTDAGVGAGSADNYRWTFAWAGDTTEGPTIPDPDIVDSLDPNWVWIAATPGNQPNFAAMGRGKNVVLKFTKNGVLKHYIIFNDGILVGGADEIDMT